MSAFKGSYAGWFTEEIKFRVSNGKMIDPSKQHSSRSSMRGKSGGRRGGQLWRIAQGSRSAMFKKIGNAGCHDPKQLAGQLAYINGKSKTVFGNASDMEFGQKSLDDDAVEEMIEGWKDGWKSEQKKPKNGHTTHLVLSFPDDVTDLQAAQIAEDWCDEMFQSRTHGDDIWHYYAALHTDTANPHVHVVVNNRGTQNGKWFYMANDHDFNYDLVREAMVDIAEDHGVFLDSATRLERGKLTYAAPSHEHQEAKRLGVPVVERPLTPEDLLAAQDVIKRYAVEAEQMAVVCAHMDMTNVHDALCAAAVNLREGKPVDVSTFLKEEQLVQLDLTQHPVDIRQTIVQWSADNADRIANADPANRDRFVKDWIAALDAIDKSIDPDAAITFGDQTGKAPSNAAYNGTFVSAAIGDQDKLTKRAENFLDSPDEIAEMHAFAASGKFTQFMMSGAFEPDEQRMIDVIGSAYNKITNDAAAEPVMALNKAKSHAAKIGLNPDTFAQRVVNGAYDARMEREWMVEDLRQVAKHHGLDSTSETDMDKATVIVHKVYDFVADNINKLHSNHIVLEPLQRSVSIDVEKDHTAFVERSRDTINMIRNFRVAVFDNKGFEKDFLEDFKQEFGKEGIERLAKGDLDVIKDLAVNEQDRRDIAYTVFKLFNRNPDIGVEVNDISAGMDRFNPKIWHGLGGHSI
jgi:type IV secretion system T-DNA border endonuclease VirD2